VSTLKDGTRTAKLDSPDQGANGIPITALELKDGELTFESKSIGAKYRGKRSADGKSFDGTFNQAGAAMPLKLEKTDKVEAPPRPQTPKPPFTYESEDVNYENKAAEVKLAGTLTIPKGDGPFPCALLITGSGAQDRDESLLGHKPFLILADYLS